MTTILPNAGPFEKTTKPCPGCGRNVIAARDDKGRPLQIEWCIRAKGTHVLTAGLLPGIEPLALPSAGKGYRVHACPTAVSPKAHSAASFEGKRGNPSISYRPSDALRRGRK